MFITVNLLMTDNVPLFSMSIYVTCMLMARQCYATVVYFKYP